MKKQKSVLTKIKTKVSTRTMLLVVLGILIVGGAGFAALAPLLKNSDTFFIKDARVSLYFNDFIGYGYGDYYSSPYSNTYTYINPYTEPYSWVTPKKKYVTNVVYSGIDGSGNAAVPLFCNMLRNNGNINYEIDYEKSGAVSKMENCVKGYEYYAFDPIYQRFHFTQCTPGQKINLYSQVKCAKKTDIYDIKDAAIKIKQKNEKGVIEEATISNLMYTGANSDAIPRLCEALKKQRKIYADSKINYKKSGPVTKPETCVKGFNYYEFDEKSKTFRSATCKPGQQIKLYTQVKCSL